MKVLVASDSHGDREALAAMLRKEPTVRIVIFLGDGAAEAQALQTDNPACTWIIVNGNCDIRTDEPTLRLVTLGGAKLYLTHGHGERVKSSLLTLTYSALQEECTAALYGHTHVPRTDYRDGVLLFNPGSLATSRTYGVLDIENGVVRSRIETL